MENKLPLVYKNDYESDFNMPPTDLSNKSWRLDYANKTMK